MKKILGLVVLFFGLPPAWALLNQDIQHNTYEIEGDTVQELHKEMNAKGPRGYFAYTSWYIRFKYDYLDQNNSCALDNIRVNLKIVYTMPEFEDLDDVDNQLRQKWINFESNLQTHEDGHAKNGLGAAQEIDAMLQNLAPMSNCEALNRLANEKAGVIIRKYNQRDLQYDAQTQHGIKQGAVL